MSEIKCPNCGKTFAVDESGYAELARQVRDDEFKRQVEAQIRQVEEKARAHEQAALAQAGTQLSKAVAEKDAEITVLQTEISVQRATAKAELELATRQAADAQAVALAQAERERDSLKVQLESQQSQAQLARETALQKAASEAADKLHAAERSYEQQLHAVERERDELKAQIERSAIDTERMEAQHKNELATREAILQEQINARDREIDNIKHMRAELSVKMIGESLEQYCEGEFNKLRATAFQTSYFQKDNDAADGSKGDYIYREFDEDGSEIVSIMFEMKNEADSSTHKKRNEDHFAKLDRDRKAKGCEYAVLVSLLERDSDFYNTGIVDVSFSSGYEKMYVIRPQFFIPLITLIRNAAMRSLDYRRELAEVRQQNVDVTYFEDQLEDFKERFGKNCDLASRKFQAAIKDINDTIKKLEKIRDELTSSDNNLRYANDKLGNLTVKRLTRKNPTMKAKFEEARTSKEAGDVPPYQPEAEWEIVEAELVDVAEADE